MYLERPAVERLLQELSDLSSPGSYLILNFINKTQNPEKGWPPVEEMDDILEKHGWKKLQQLFFGDEAFSFGRYPPGKPANKLIGFAFYEKITSDSP